MPTVLFRRPVDLRLSWQLARTQFAALVAERDALKNELAEAYETMRGVAAIIRAAKTTTANQLEALTRQRDIERAESIQRDPDQQLQ
jgi:hypothetical protein